MTAHELGKALLAAPDLPVLINGWGSDEGIAHEVKGVAPTADPESFRGAKDDESTQKDSMGWPLPRPCIALLHL